MKLIRARRTIPAIVNLANNGRQTIGEIINKVGRAALSSSVSTKKRFLRLPPRCNYIMKRPHWYSEHEVSLIFLHGNFRPSRRSSMPFVFCFPWDQFVFSALSRQCVIRTAASERGRQSHFTPSVLCEMRLQPEEPESVCARTQSAAGVKREPQPAKTQNALAHLPRAPDELFIALDLSTTLYFYSCHFDGATFTQRNKQNKNKEK